jgi:hemerythrin
MSVIEWNENYSVRIDEVDKQHKKLIALLNELADAMTVGKGRDVVGTVLTELVNYTVYHFSTEERLFEQYGYPAAQEHKRQHEDLTEQAKKLKADFDDGNWMITIDVLKFLSAWLNDHILGQDKKYASFLTSKGVR